MSKLLKRLDASPGAAEGQISRGIKKVLDMRKSLREKYNRELGAAKRRKLMLEIEIRNNTAAREALKGEVMRLGEEIGKKMRENSQEVLGLIGKARKARNERDGLNLEVCKQKLNLTQVVWEEAERLYQKIQPISNQIDVLQIKVAELQRMRQDAVEHVPSKKISDELDKIVKLVIEINNSICEVRDSLVQDMKSGPLQGQKQYVEKQIEKLAKSQKTISSGIRSIRKNAGVLKKGKEDGNFDKLAEETIMECRKITSALVEGNYAIWGIKKRYNRMSADYHDDAIQQLAERASRLHGESVVLSDEIRRKRADLNKLKKVRDKKNEEERKIQRRINLLEYAVYRNKGDTKPLERELARIKNVLLSVHDIVDPVLNLKEMLAEISEVSNLEFYFSQVMETNDKESAELFNRLMDFKFEVGEKDDRISEALGIVRDIGNKNKSRADSLRAIKGGPEMAEQDETIQRREELAEELEAASAEIGGNMGEIVASLERLHPNPKLDKTKETCREAHGKYIALTRRLGELCKTAVDTEYAEAIRILQMRASLSDRVIKHAEDTQRSIELLRRGGTLKLDSRGVRVKK